MTTLILIKNRSKLKEAYKREYKLSITINLLSRQTPQTLEKSFKIKVITVQTFSIIKLDTLLMSESKSRLVIESSY